MSKVVVTHSASITVGEKPTMGEGVPDSARVTITSYGGDFRESGYTTITMNW